MPPLWFGCSVGCSKTSCTGFVSATLGSFCETRYSMMVDVPSPAAL
jgi:hypothetical protein